MLIVNESVKFLTVVLVIKILQLFTVICQVSLKRNEVDSVILVQQFIFILVFIQFSVNHFYFYSVLVLSAVIHFSSYSVLVLDKTNL